MNVQYVEKWKPYVSKSIIVHEIRSPHREMFNAVSREKIAEIINRYLKEVN